MPEQDKLAPSVACCDLVNRGIAYANGKDSDDVVGCEGLRA